jgi:predicted nucleic acid-binding protein
VALFAYWDASGLVKRYVSEAGSPLVTLLFQRVPADRMVCLKLGTLEVVSIFVRKKNAQSLPSAAFQQVLADFRAEVLGPVAFTKVTASDALLDAALPFVVKHSINSTDAVVLRSALDLAAVYRANGDDLVLVASDQRLLRAAQVEGLTTFNPETQSQTDLDALIGP